ncbi:Transport ATP-binding protein CydC [Minicystis rosea]|nr:Transport ATP-binding protein CydC [Minicystis rosea]
MTPVDAYAWPLERLGEAMHALARRAHLGPRDADMPPRPDPALARDSRWLGAWIEAAAERIAIEVEPVEAWHRDVSALVQSAGPALFRLPGEGDARLLAVIGGERRSVRLLGPDLEERRVSIAAVRDALCAPLEAAPRAVADRLLDLAGVPAARRDRARTAMIRERLASARIGGAWLLRLPPGASVRGEIRAAGLGRRALALLGARGAEYGLGLLAWWMLGLGALQGRIDRGYLLAWGLVLVTQIPFRMLAVAAQGRLAIDAGAILKRRLLAGALALAPEEVRHDGAGALLGRVIESEAVESLSLSAGFDGILAILELLVSGVLLALGAGHGLSLAVLLVWIALTAGAFVSYLRRRRAWTEARVGMTHDLVERMVGHRTRLAQQPRDRWHDGEDEAAERYLGLSRSMDHASVTLAALPRAFLVVAAAALVPSFLSSTASSGELAVGLGATLLAYRAVAKLTSGVTSLAGALIAWEKVKPLWDAAARAEPAKEPLLALAPRAPSEVLLEAHELTFRYSERGRQILRGATLRIAPGDRLLLEGGSGGGKSTFGSILAGLRVPEEGLLLIGGLDRRTLGGAGFRRFVVAAPQFHENHVLSATFSFNLLMGRGWPPGPSDLEEARRICEELDLGPLLARMPAGLEQMVGETGWQLSHGEKSRLFMARALLQRAELIVLDESFAALDPATLARALRCVLSRARAVLVIAHP